MLIFGKEYIITSFIKLLILRAATSSLLFVPVQKEEWKCDDKKED